MPVDRRTDLRGEDEAVVVPEFGEFLSFLQLELSVGGDGRAAAADPGTARARGRVG